jgi:hypothetical protein
MRRQAQMSETVLPHVADLHYGDVESSVYWWCESSWLSNLESVGQPGVDKWLHVSADKLLFYMTFIYCRNVSLFFFQHCNKGTGICVNVYRFNNRSRAGLFHVDFNHPDKIRTPKKSTEFVKTVTRQRKIPPRYAYYGKELNQLEFNDPS